MAVSRRQLFVGAAAGTGLLLGWAVWPRAHAPALSAGPDESVLSSWVKLGSDGRVTIAIPQAEMGQGIWSGLAQILADEMGADWETVAVEPATLAPDYANRYLIAKPMEALPAVVRGLATGIGVRVVEYFDFQITGGSGSVRGYEAPLRAAGAVARDMLCRAAAARLGVSADACDTQGGFVIHKANRIPFADLAVDAAALDPPSEPQLRTTRTLSGKPLLRLDVPSKTDGSARFGADVRLPGMHYAAIDQGPIGARRTGIANKRMPPGCQLVEADDFVAVVAPGWWQAKKALDALDIRYDLGELPPGPWMTAKLDAALDNQDGLETKRTRDDGDAVPLLDTPTPDGVSADYALPFLAHACMETMTATARITDGRCEVWLPTQSLTLSSWAVARTLDLDDEAVTVYPTLLGGGFGRKVETDAAKQVAIIARASGKPVQLIWSREEDFGHDCYRPPVAARMRATLEGSGGGARIKALAVRLAAPDLSAGVMARNVPKIAGSPKAGGQIFDGMETVPYALPAVALEHILVDTPVPLGFWRSVGNSYTGFLMESFMDELAARAGVDPAAFRLAHLEGKPRHAAVLRTVVDMAGNREPATTEGVRTATGIALWESFESIVAMAAAVRIAPGEAPMVTQLWIAADCGRVINPDSVQAQLEGAALFGLSAALTGSASFADGEALERNFDTSPLLDMASAPAIEITLIASNEPPGGVGETGTPPVAPAVANAIALATGERRRRLPLGGPVGRKPVNNLNAAAADPAAAATPLDSAAEMPETVR